MPGTDPLCPPSLLILRQPPAAAEADFARAGDRGRTGDLVLGKPIDSGHHTISAHRRQGKLPLSRRPLPRPMGWDETQSGTHPVHTCARQPSPSSCGLMSIVRPQIVNKTPSRHGEGPMDRRISGCGCCQIRRRRRSRSRRRRRPAAPRTARSRCPRCPTW